MTDQTSIKSQIVTLIVKLLSDALTPDNSVRKVTRTRNLTINESIRPAIQVYAGPEHLLGKDNRGRTFSFEIAIKVLVDDSRDGDAALDKLVPEVQRILESNLQLNGLANIVDGGDEIPFTTEADKPQGGSLVAYTIQYRRVLGDPYTAY